MRLKWFGLCHEPWTKSTVGFVLDAIDETWRVQRLDQVGQEYEYNGDCLCENSGKTYL